jgi:hypothetical protein
VPRPRTVSKVTSDPALHDDQLETEIKLVGDLVLAASQSEQHLTDQRIDEVLGLERAASKRPDPTADGTGRKDGTAAGGGDGSDADGVDQSDAASRDGSAGGTSDGAG